MFLRIGLHTSGEPGWRQLNIVSNILLDLDNDEGPQSRNQFTNLETLQGTHVFE